MQFTAAEIAAMAFLSSRYPGEQVTANITLIDGGVGYLSLSVPKRSAGKVPLGRVLYDHYMASPTGRVWESTNGRDRGKVIRESDFETLLTSAPQEDRHVPELIEHLASLEDEQCEAVRAQLNLWHDAAQRDDRPNA